MSKMKLVFSLAILACMFSCQKNSWKEEAGKIIKEWKGKEIRFPDDFQCNVLGKDTASTLCIERLDTEFKILLYVDSTGCSDCRLKLIQWQQLIEEADSLFEENLSFLLFFQPKNKKDLEYLFRRNYFDYPVFVDVNSTINRLNHFPEKMEYQCFLLDKSNKVQLIGNPAMNSKIWELYKQTISGQTQTGEMLVTTVSIEQAEMEINDLQVKKKKRCVFKLKNTGNQPLLIARVDTSCGCTVPSWDKKPIEPGEKMEISVEIQPEEVGFFYKTIQMHCNVEKGVIPLAIKGNVSKN
jgi:hypothetical protein